MNRESIGITGEDHTYYRTQHDLMIARNNPQWKKYGSEHSCPQDRYETFRVDTGGNDPFEAKAGFKIDPTLCGDISACNPYICADPTKKKPYDTTTIEGCKCSCCPADISTECTDPRICTGHEGKIVYDYDIGCYCKCPQTTEEYSSILDDPYNWYSYVHVGMLPHSGKCPQIPANVQFVDCNKK